MLVKVAGTDVPLVSIGTSPFIGAGQFGFKGLIWRRTFLNDPRRMAELMIQGFKLGILGAHILPVGAIPIAVKLVRDTIPDYLVIGSLMPPPDLKESLETLISLESKIIFIHGEISDRRRKDQILSIIDIIKEMGATAGVATHTYPVRTLKFLLTEGIKVPVLLPFNLHGSYMEDQPELERLVDESHLECIAMKVLDAGRLSPKNAISYVVKHNIKAITVGMTSVQELEELSKSMVPLVNKMRRFE